VEEEWEEHQGSVNIMKEVQQKMAAFMDGEEHVGASVNISGSLQREVAVIGRLQQMLQSQQEAILQRQKGVEETGYKLQSLEALLKQVQKDLEERGCQLT